MIICLNGTSSSGKTAIARDLQELLPGYVLNFSIDSILYALPRSALLRMTSGQRNPGLDYPRLDEGFYRCCRALAELGHDLIIDNAVVTPRSAALMVEVLDGLPVALIGVSCSLDELKQRELQRGDRTIGEAEAQLGRVHAHCAYDLHVDSTRASPRDLACAIRDFVSSTTTFTGLTRTKLLLAGQ